MAQTEFDSLQPPGRAELIAALADARSAISRDATELAERADFPQSMIRSTFADTQVRRAATALVAGVVSSRFLSRRRGPARHAKTTFLERLFPDLDTKTVIQLLLKKYGDPEQAELRAVLHERLREFLK